MRLLVLLQELTVELDNAVNPLGAGSEEGGSEVKGALLLAETGASDDADTGGLEETHAVELIGGSALSLGGLSSLCRECDGREEVHGTLGLAALDTLHLVKGLVEGVGTLSETLEDAAELLVVELV